MTNIERGQLLILDTFAEFTLDDAQEMARRYAQELRQLTGGQGLAIEN